MGFYYLVQLTYDMPNIVNGHLGFLRWPSGGRSIISGLTDLGIYFLFALVPYQILFKFFPRKRILEAIGIILLCLPLLFLLRYASEELWVLKSGRNSQGPVTRLRTYFTGHIFYIILYSVYGMTFYFIRYAYYRELQQKELELQNRESELSFLRSQINPHFLFNSLNNIYSLVYLKSEHSLEAIAGFSELLRYMLYDTLQDVPLEREVDYIRKYIDLQQLRYEYPVKTDLQVKGNLEDVFIPPLLLIPFVENAYKHGVVSEQGDGIVISIDAGSSEVRFYCQNKISRDKKDLTGGIGLRNLRRRLQLLYPGKHQLEIMDGPVYFIVKLELNHV
ncbi:MAG: sensor histidine kinase [Chitinophagaceae bacterium]